MDQELLTYLERQFHETHQRSERMEAQIGSLHQGLGALQEEVGTLREETRQRFEQVDEQIRHLHILVEGGREETRLLAEGMMGFNHVMERTEREVNLKLDELRTLVTPLYRRIDERVTHLEEREGQKTRDVMELIRERFAMPRTL
jgi:archaellum component FlaC